MGKTRFINDKQALHKLHRMSIRKPRKELNFGIIDNVKFVNQEEDKKASG